MHTNLVVLLSAVIFADIINLVSSKSIDERLFILGHCCWVAFTLLTVIGVIK